MGAAWLTEKIWCDMIQFDGYVAHELVSRPRTRFVGRAVSVGA
jgi:hypothetical protein